MTKAAARKKRAPEPVARPVEPTVLVDGAATIRWVSEALAAKDVGPAMTHYSVAGGYIRSSNGKLTAAHPWPDDASFLVSGIEFEKVLARMEDDEPTVAYRAEANDVLGKVTEAASVEVRSGRFSATIATLPSDTWTYPGVDGSAEWHDVPDGFTDLLRVLRAFISDNPAQAWQGGVSLENGNMYATNNIAVAGGACTVGDVKILLPAHAVDFILRRVDGLKLWTHTENYAAFQWDSGAWMRTVLIDGKFHEKASEMVREVYTKQPTQEITDEFREAFADVAGLAEDDIRIYADRMESKFKRSVVTAPCKCEVPDGKECSIWQASVLAPVVAQATHWQPSMHPKPAPFRGENVAGFIVGRKAD